MIQTRLATAFFLAMLSSPLGAQQFERPEPKDGFSYPDYFCTNRGVRVEVEDLSCLTVGGKSFVAKCDISLNNPMWRATGETCVPGSTSELHAVIPN